MPLQYAKCMHILNSCTSHEALFPCVGETESIRRPEGQAAGGEEGPEETGS